MANAKISDDLVFIPETSDVRDIGGLAGFTGSANAKISGAFLAQSVVNESGSGIGTNDGSGNINSRVAFYGVGNPSNTLAGAEGFQYYSANSGNSTEASLQLGVAGGNQYDVGNLILKGNYIGGSTSAKIEFRSNDTGNPNAFKSFIIKGSDAASDDQTWILPRTLPTAGQILKANTVSSQDVGLSWTDAASGGGIDFSSLSIATIKADLTQSSQTQYGQAVTVKASSAIDNGAVVIWDYSGTEVKAKMPSGATPDQHEIIGIAIEDIASGNTGKVLVYGYATAKFVPVAGNVVSNLALTTGTVNGGTTIVSDINNATTFTDANVGPNNSYASNSVLSHTF